MASTRAVAVAVAAGHHRCTIVRVESGSSSFGFSKSAWVSAVSTRTMADIDLDGDSTTMQRSLATEVKRSSRKQEVRELRRAMRRRLSVVAS